MVHLSKRKNKKMIKLSLKKKSLRRALTAALTLLVGAAPVSPAFSGVRAATLSGASIALSDSRPSTASTYTFDFDGVSLSTIKCIKVVLSDAATGGSAPTGISTTGVTYNAAGSDFVPDVQTWTAAEITTGSFKITNSTGEIPGSATDATVLVTGITNGSTAETGYFAQFSTYNNIDCATTPVDSGVGTFIYATGQAVSLTVDATLSFNIAAVNSGSPVDSASGPNTTVTTTDGTIPFGTVTTSANSIAAHDLTITTNAGSGYTVYTRYTQAPTNGAASIDDLATYTNASPGSFSAAGTEAFGYTTNDGVLGTGTTTRFATTPQWAAFTTSNLEVAYSAAAVSSQTTRVGYEVGISGTTPAGLYNNSTVIFTATPAY